MFKRTRRLILAGLVVAGIVATGVALARAAGQQSPVYTERGLALSGYDAVAYMTEGRAVKGRAEFSRTWNGAVWHFASARHRDLFIAAPEKYAPQFGGYCAWAVSRGYTADADPEAWRVVDGKLYVNYSKRVQRLWEQDVAGNIAKGRANWPRVLSR